MVFREERRVKRDSLLILTVKRIIVIFDYCAKIVVVGQNESISYSIF